MSSIAQAGSTGRMYPASFERGNEKNTVITSSQTQARRCNEAAPPSGRAGTSKARRLAADCQWRQAVRNPGISHRDQGSVSPNSATG